MERGPLHTHALNIGVCSGLVPVYEGSFLFDNMRSVHVSNLHESISKDDLKALFRAHGRVKRVKIMYKKAIVTFKSEVEARRAVEHLDGLRLNGKVIMVQRPLQQVKRRRKLKKN